MPSVPHETTDPIPISVAAIKLLARMRAYQMEKRVRKDGPAVPRLRLMEMDLDKLLETLPHEGLSHELVKLSADDVEQIKTMRGQQREAFKKRDYDDREMKVSERAVDAILKALDHPRIAQESRALVGVGAAQESDDEEPGVNYWMPYKDD